MIVAVTGGKGGVGKSTTSLNLGCELDAVIVDADLATADLPPGNGRGPTLHDVLAGRAHPMDAIVEAGPVRILPSGRTLEGARASNLDILVDVAEQLERECGRVVLDCPAGLARDVGIELYSADLAVLVTTPDRVALTDAYRTRELARDVGTPVASVVLNQCVTPPAEEFRQRVEETMGAPVTTIDRCDEIAAAQEAGSPVRAYAPESPAVERFETVTWTVERCEQRISGRIGVL